MWAEEWGLGELGLQPDQFWSLTYREFEIKRKAFARAEDRAKALMLEHVSRSVHMKPQNKNALDREANTRRRYPVKQWLKP